MTYLDPEVVEKARELALDCVRHSGQLAKQLRSRARSDIKYKSDNSIVTEADTLIQQKIIERIKREFPEHGIVAEEVNVSKLYGTLTKASSKFIWVIDPIDGTRKYVQKRSRYYGTAIGLLCDGHPVLAVFFAPEYRAEARREGALFEAYTDREGAFLNGKRICVSTNPHLEKEDAIISYSVQAIAPNWKDLFNVHFSKVYTRTGSGDLGLCRVASSGVYTGPVLYAFGETDIWNIVVGGYIVTKAGGLCISISGKPVFPLDPELIRHGNTKQESILAGNPKIVERFGSLFKVLELPNVRVLGYRVEKFEGFHTISAATLTTLAEDLERTNQSVIFARYRNESTNALTSHSITKAVEEGDDKEKAAASVILEQFGERLGAAIRQLLKWEYWKGTQRIYLGGGMAYRQSGDIIIKAAKNTLQKGNKQVELRRIQYPPDNAGLIGSVYLIPPNKLKVGDGIVSVDIGGTKVRVGLLQIMARDTDELAVPMVKHDTIRYHHGVIMNRDDLIDLIVELVVENLEKADDIGVSISKYLTIGCPGMIDKHGYIVRGARNLPGEWASPNFHLASALNTRFEDRGYGRFEVLVHNDAVVQGLSQLPFVQGVKEWGVLTLGTGLGNARFQNTDLWHCN